MNQENEIFDTIIIGGGPCGLFTTFYGGMRGMNVKLIESLPELGGQLAALYPEKYIYDVAGFPKVQAKELIGHLKEQAFHFNPSVSLGESVENVEKIEERHFKVTTNKDTYHAKTVIITGGVGAFQPRRLTLDNADTYEDQNLFYSVKDLQSFKGQRVVLSGGGDSAVDWALTLEPIAESVTLVHRRDKFRAHEHSVEQLMNSSVDIKTPYAINELIGDGNTIQQVQLTDKKGEDTPTIDVDAVIVNHGFKSSLGPMKEWGIEIEKNSIVVNTRMETNIEGIYSAGDITTYDGKVKLIATGFGEGPNAINHAKSYIDPKSRIQPMHSTSLFGD